MRPRAAQVAFGAFGDRFDHELASINALYAYRGRFRRLLLMGERCDRSRPRPIPPIPPILLDPTHSSYPLGSHPFLLSSWIPPIPPILLDPTHSSYSLGSHPFLLSSWIPPIPPILLDPTHSSYPLDLRSLIASPIAIHAQDDSVPSGSRCASDPTESRAGGPYLRVAANRRQDRLRHHDRHGLGVGWEGRGAEVEEREAGDGSARDTRVSHVQLRGVACGRKGSDGRDLTEGI